MMPHIVPKYGELWEKKPLFAENEITLCFFFPYNLRIPLTSSSQFLFNEKCGQMRQVRSPEISVVSRLKYPV